MGKARVLWGMAAMAAGLVISGGARADAIDGNWCSADNRHMVILGPKITTPGGAQITGIYSRHGFIYTIPAGEPHAGAEVDMALMNEITVHLRMRGAEFGDQPTEIEVWKRCEVIS